MEIKPTDISRSQVERATLDPKIAKLLSNIANRPLLLEKLVVSQSQGLLVQLTSQTKPTKNLSLQLPLSLSRAFENVNQTRTEVSVVISANQRVIISISQPISNTISSAPPAQRLDSSTPATANIDTTTPSNIKTSQSTLSNKTVQQEIIQFRTAILLPDKIIKLLDPAPPTPNQLKLFNSANGIIISHKIMADKIDGASNSVTTKKQSETSLATIAAQLLGQNFSKKNPVASHLTQIKQIITQLKSNQFQSPSVNKLIQQIERLISDVKISSLPTAKNIKQRVLSSGNLLENLASKNLIARNRALQNNNAEAAPQSTKLQQQNSPAQKESSSEIPKSLRHFVTSDVKIESAKKESSLNDKTSTNSVASKNQNLTKTPTDLKLQLMQIRATLESLIKNGGGKLESKNTVEPSQPSATRLRTQPVSSNIRTQQNIETTNQHLGNQLNKSDALLQTIQNAFSQSASSQNSSAQKSLLLLSQQNLILRQSNELLTEVRSIISQIENNQLQSLRSDQTSIQQFLVDLPFANDPDIDSFELLFETQNDQLAAQKIKSWKVVVRFDLEPLGAMFAQIELVNERISTHIFAESQQTATLINQHMHVLKKSLSSAGVDIDELKGSQGNIPEKLIKDDPNKVDVRV